MSGRKETIHIDMAGVSSLGRKEKPAGSKSARRGAGHSSAVAGARKAARSRRL
jgi:hypothetical protein